MGLGDAVHLGVWRGWLGERVRRRFMKAACEVTRMLGEERRLCP